jgi:hypothetical protein
MAADNGVGGTDMSTIALDYLRPGDDQSRRVIGWRESVVLAGAGILLPMVCFAASLNRYLGAPDFQRGEWSDYLTLMPSVMASWPFAPLLFAATFAMAVLVIAPHRVVHSRVLRWALYSGVILAAQYTLIQAIAIAEPSGLLSWGTLAAISGVAIATVLMLGGLWLVPRVPRIKLVYCLPSVVVVFIAAAVGWRIALPIVLVSAILIAAVAPAITLAAYLRFSYIVWKLAGEEPRADRRILLGVPLAWLATYGIAWGVAFINAIELYNSLPKTPPDC